MKQVLNHGFIRLVDVWGREELEEAVGEESIIAAARMSTGKGFLGWGPKEGTCSKCGLSEADAKARAVDAGKARDFCDDGVSVAHDFKREPGDEKLLRFLWENKHATPFEMAGATIEVQAPIFVFREWHRHRTQSYSEMSSRYTPLPDFNYIPTVDRVLINSATNKQAGTIKGAGELTAEVAEALLAEERELHVKLEDFYQRKLRAGFPKELARTHLPVSRYSRMRASTDLRNWLAFLALREAPGAQYEIRVYAKALHDLLAERFPRTLALFSERS